MCSSVMSTDESNGGLMVLSFITGPSTTPSIPFLDYRRWRIPRAKTVAIGSRSQPRPLGDGIPTLQLMILNGRLFSNPVQLNELFFPETNQRYQANKTIC